MTEVVNILEKKLGQGRVKKDVSLANYTTFRVGGPAKYFFIAKSLAELIMAVNLVKKTQLPFIVFGGGSNILFSDRGFAGLVIRNESNEIKITKRIGKFIKGKTQIKECLVEVDSGVLINRLVRFCCEEGLAGLEYHLGLPGSVGGAVYMNSKWTKPQTVYVGDVLYQAKILSSDNTIKSVDNNYFKFDYDYSILQKTGEILLRVVFLLKNEAKEILWQRANQAMEYRKISQPMGVATAGCAFRNISLTDAIRLSTPNHTTSAGYLLDQAGLKGMIVGGAKFSEKHGNFIINFNSATSKDILQLIDMAKKRVLEKYGVQLKPEIILPGEFK